MFGIYETQGQREGSMFGLLLKTDTALPSATESSTNKTCAMKPMFPLNQMSLMSSEIKNYSSEHLLRLKLF